MQNLEKKENLAAIRPQIQFISEVEEMTVPRRVRLTKSENGETGTATFLFFEPTIFSVFINSSSQNSNRRRDGCFVRSFTKRLSDLVWGARRS